MSKAFRVGVTCLRTTIWSGMATNESSFQRLKAICVPLLGKSQLTPSVLPVVSSLLSELDLCLNELRNSSALTGPLISYTFFPITTILRRNPSSAITDQLLEKLLSIMTVLCDAWWWDCDSGVWEQNIMFCGAVLGGMVNKSEGTSRDDETKLAATKCVHALLRQRKPEDLNARSDIANVLPEPRLEQLQRFAFSEKMVPVFGQMLSSLLGLLSSNHLPLQILSLQTVEVVISAYIPEKVLPAVLPGVISNSAKAALGVSRGKGWASGDIVENALRVMKAIIVGSIGDDICVREGAVYQATSLEELGNTFELKSAATNDQDSPKKTMRTPSWLQATSSQVHIALNSLSPLVMHTNPKALHALIDFSSTILTTTLLTMPQSQTLLISQLLSLSRSTFPNVAGNAQQALSRLLSPSSNTRTPLWRTIIDLTRDNLSALPRLIYTHADPKVQHVAGIIEAICSLATLLDEAPLGNTLVTSGLGQLLGPNGGIEKWGWTLIGALEMAESVVTVTQEDYRRLLQSESTNNYPFPTLTMKHIEAAEAREALSRMLQALGRAAGDGCLYSIEWLTSAGIAGRDSEAVTALWCAGRLLEGAGHVLLNSADQAIMRTKRPRLEKTARGLAMSIAETWDKDEPVLDNARPDFIDPGQSVELVKGTLNLPDHLKIVQNTRASKSPPKSRRQYTLHRVACLQLLAITAGILQAQFTPLLLHVLYPIIHSIIVDDQLVSSTGWASLQFVTICTSYASPANLLLSNFDYALDSISRRLSRRWLDPDATRVLSLLVRLVGSEIVDRAGDIVEECFDRLDDYHGYENIVEGLVSVLDDVVAVVAENEPPLIREDTQVVPEVAEEKDMMGKFEDWFVHRCDTPQDEKEDFGPPQFPLGREKENKMGEQPDESSPNDDGLAPPPPTPVQELTKQIVSRSLYFLTHGSATIRSKILGLLASSVQVLPESAILPSVHQAWPFVLNRLTDQQPFVISAAASFIESLSAHMGSFMTRRVWDDVWPKFRKILSNLETADSASALARRGVGSVGTKSAYTHSHRLYRSILKTMISAVSKVRALDSASWDVIMAFRRFLHKDTHPELQTLAKALYKALSKNNSDAVWLALSSTSGQLDVKVTTFMTQTKWDIVSNIKDLELEHVL